MSTVKIIDPVTRLEGHLKIEVTVDDVGGKQQVVDAKASGTLFRGFEQILVGRDPQDAQHITQRICGVCSVPHGMAAVMAQDTAFNVSPPTNARIMRNLVMAANFIQSHILHFYHLALQDFLDGPAMPPWQPSWNVDKRISGTGATNLVNHYVTAIDMTRKAHEMGALFGGRMPDPPAYIAGGFTATPRADRITKFKAYLSELTTFINTVYLPDVNTLKLAYPDYTTIGGGYGNLLSFGVFDLDAQGSSKLLKRGRSVNASQTVNTVDVNQITEAVTYSWYNDATTNLRPAAGQTAPQYPKANAYSWLKAPRYANAPYEAGPLARMWVNGDYRTGISVMDRHQARAQETLKIANACQTWVSQLQSGGAYYATHTIPASASSYGLTEAPRGALGHWLQLASSKISRYQVVTPTCWNASPRDGAGAMGPIEKALIGTPVISADQPVEVLRVIHSFDPCLSCAVHVSRPKEKGKVIVIEEPHTH
jgi:hydrogenase large subunit